MSEQTPLSVHEPDGPPTGGIVVIQEAFGVNDHIEDVARRLAADGWLAVAPHLFHRSGDPKLGYGDMSVVMPHMQALTADGVLADVDAALDQLARAGIPPERIGVVGFCLGGTVTLVTAARRDVGAAVTFYGDGDPLARALRRSRSGDPRRRRGAAPGRRRLVGAGDRGRPLSRGGARLPLRPALQLRAEVGAGRLGSHPGVVPRPPRGVT